MISSAELTALFGQLLWPLFRCGTALWWMPAFGGRGVPRHARLALACSLAWLVSGQIPALDPVEPLSIDALMLTLEQIAIGLSFAMIMQLLFTVFTLAGQMMSMQMGLAMAVMNDPQRGPGVPLIGRWLEIFTLMVFLAMDGHLVVIRVLADSFHSMPIGSGIQVQDFMDLVLMGQWLFSAALLVALPAVFSMLMVNFCFGVMSRAASQLNIFALGFPMTMIFGMITLLLVMASLPDVFLNMTEETLLILRSYAGQG